MSSPRPWPTGLLALALMAPAWAMAQTVDPLSLQPTEDDAPAAPPPGASSLRLEAWAQGADLRHPVPGVATRQQRAVLDFRHEWRSLEEAGWTLSGSGRLEQVRGHDGGGHILQETRFALREAYASREWAPGRYVDVGRLQWRNGVAAGFNPSDFLQRGAVLDLGTQNPQALRENRLGTVMLRHQWLGASGSLQLGWIPRLSSGGVHDNPRSPGWERTNSRDAALLRWAPNTGEGWSAEGLLQVRAGEPSRWAANITRGVGDAWIVYAEWAGGPAQAPAHSSHWQQALATGATWTSPWRWGLTLERHQASLPGTSDAWFSRLSWDKAFGADDLTLSGFVRRTTGDHSRLWQLDARWHVNDRHSLALIWGGTDGAAGSEYGRLPMRRQALVSWTIYLP